MMMVRWVTDDLNSFSESEYIFVFRSRQRSSSEPGDTQSSYKGSPNTVLLVDDSAVVAAPRVCHQNVTTMRQL